MPDEQKPKLRLGDDGELYTDDNPTQPLEKPKRKAKPTPPRATPIMMILTALVAALLVMVGCLLSLNLVSSRLVRATATFAAAAPTATPRAPTPTFTASPTRTPAPTRTPTLVITPPVVGIGERPLCAGIGGAERITFDTVYGDANREVYLLDLSLPPDANICRLTNDSRTDSDPVWHPDGNSILFNREGELTRLNADGSGMTALLSGRDAQWDNTGDWFVFAGLESGNIEVAAWDGTARRLISDMPAWDEYAPDCCSLNFSALLPVVVFAAAPREGERPGTSDANAREIYAVNADGTGRTQLTRNAEYDDEPEWSPGGNQIVFTRGMYGFNTDIWIMNADGSNPINLTRNPESTDHSPRWLPDGRIMFVSERERAGAIYVMNADGSDVRPITAPLGVLTFDYWKAADFP